MHIYICIPPFRSRVIYRTIIDSIRLSITHLFSKYCYISPKKCWSWKKSVGRKVSTKEIEDEPRVVSYAVDWRAGYERFRSHRLHFSSTVFFSAFPREKPLPTIMNHRPTSPLLISRRLSAASLSRLFRSPDRKRRNDRIFRTNIYKPCIHHVGTRFSIEPSLHPRTLLPFFLLQYRGTAPINFPSTE